MKTFTLVLLVAAVVAAALVLAPATSESRADQTTPLPAQGLVHEQHLLVLHGGMISVYSLAHLPDLKLENTVALPTSIAEGARAMRLTADSGSAAPSKAAVEAGKKVYDDNGCSDCHKIDGKGGTTGPDLTHVGSVRSREYLVKIITDPNSVAPGSMMPPYELPKEKLDDLVDYMLSLK